MNTNINEETMIRANNIIKKMQQYYRNTMVGQLDLEMSLLVSFIANGHILIESVPGLAKTTAAKTLAKSVAGKFSRIQCTPDLLPSDIIGMQLFNYQTSSFETKLGPVYSNFVLLDEINRSSAKTQSAMLEAMQEHQVSIGGINYKMPEVFIVIATQNPIEQEGTYLLAEAQLDRFLLKEKVKYPTVKEEVTILNRIEGNMFNETPSILSIEDLKFLQTVSKNVYIDESLKMYISSIINATRFPKGIIDDQFVEYIIMGASPRGTIAFMEAAKALALLNGRTYVIPEDIKLLKYPILRHRISLNFAAVADNVTVENIIDAIFDSIRTP